jgi:hypothetical protein
MSIILCAFHYDLAHHFMHQNMWSCGHLSMSFAPSSRVLLMPNSNHLTQWHYQLGVINYQNQTWAFNGSWWCALRPIHRLIDFAAKKTCMMEQICRK